MSWRIVILEKRIRRYTSKTGRIFPNNMIIGIAIHVECTLLKMKLSIYEKVINGKPKHAKIMKK